MDDDHGDRHREQPDDAGHEVHRVLDQGYRRVGAPGGPLHVVGEGVLVERVQPHRGGDLEQPALDLPVDPGGEAVLGVAGDDAETTPRRGDHGQRGQRR
jgi:hypothetical protein